MIDFRRLIALALVTLQLGMLSWSVSAAVVSDVIQSELSASVDPHGHADEGFGRTDGDTESATHCNEGCHAGNHLQAVCCVVPALAPAQASTAGLTSSDIVTSPSGAPPFHPPRISAV